MTTNATRFDDACSMLEALLAGQARREIVADASHSSDLGGALRRLRDAMRANVFRTGGRTIRLQKVVAALDARARPRGFHVLHDWDGKADRVNPDTIPVDVLNYLLDKRGNDGADAGVLAILLDYHVVYLLTLTSLFIWDHGDADENLERLNRLVGELQGANGSGQGFVANAETLFLLAGSHFQLSDAGYDALLEEVRTLDRRHQVNIARCHAAGLGSHLRFGFGATYGNNVDAMRKDNVADYPWLCFSLATLVREYARMSSEDVRGAARDAVVEAIFNGLSPDVGAFVESESPPALAPHERERREFAEAFRAHRPAFLADAERLRPSDEHYSPLSFFFNFSQNVLKGTVVDALMWGEPWPLSLNDLLTGTAAGGTGDDRQEKLARILMGYARTSPDRIRGRLVPAIVYDPALGRRVFATAVRDITRAAGDARAS